MKPTPQAIENAARKICQSGKFETGQGTCAVLCMDQLGDVRKKGCGHCARVHGKLARDVLSTDLGDMVLVPKEATDEMLKAALHVTRNEPYGPADDCIGGAVYRAMLAAAEDSNDQG